MHLFNVQIPTPRHQPSAIRDQANPVQNTWYTVLDVARPCVIYKAIMQVLVAGETLEARITIDGVVNGPSSVAAVAATQYTIRLHNNMVDEGLYLSAGADDMHGRSFVMCRSFRAEIRKTTNNGNGNLRGKVIWGAW